MKLYMVPAAPNPTKVMLYIAERKAMGVDLGVEQIVVNTLKGKHKEPEHLARNPFGTLPVLELESGERLVESLSIILYLETIQSDNALLSGSEIEKALARDLERTIELRLANSVGGYVHAVNSPLGCHLIRNWVKNLKREWIQRWDIWRVCWETVVKC